jgi:hypothetical protein
MECTCGHDFFDHRAIQDDVRHSGTVGACRFDRQCGCEQFEEKSP